jgi:hypothetical protein
MNARLRCASHLLLAGCLACTTSKSTEHSGFTRLVDSLQLHKAPVRLGPYAKAKSDSTFDTVLARLGRIVRNGGLCDSGVAKWSSPDGGIFVYNHGPDVLPVDPTSKLWEVVIAYDSAPHNPPCS